jgi:hypothetical protein
MMGRVGDRDRLGSFITSYRMLHPAGRDSAQSQCNSRSLLSTQYSLTHETAPEPRPMPRHLENLSQTPSTTKKSLNSLSKKVRNRVDSTATKVCKTCRRPEVATKDQEAKEARLLNIIRYCTSKTGMDPFIRSSLNLDAPELLAEHNESMDGISTTGGSLRKIPEAPAIQARPDIGISNISQEMRETRPVNMAETARCDAYFDNGMVQSAAILDEIPFASSGSRDEFALSDEQNKELEALMLEWQRDGTLPEGSADALLQPPVQDSRATPEFFPELMNSGLI